MQVKEAEADLQTLADTLARKFDAPITVMLTASSNGRSYCAVHLEHIELAYVSAPTPDLALRKAEMESCNT